MRVGIVSRTATYWPLYVLAREDRTLELVELGSTAAGVDALLERRVDVAATCPDVLITRRAPLRIAAGLVGRPPTTVVARAGIRTIEELRGRRIAVTSQRGSVSIFLRALLRRHGLSTADYCGVREAHTPSSRPQARSAEDYTQIVCGTTPNQAQAVKRGVVDAAMLSSPFDEWLTGHGFVALASVGDELGPCAFTTLNVRPGGSATPEWRALADALVRTAERLGDPATLRVLSDETGVRSAHAPRVSYDTRLDVAALERLLAFMRDDGLEAAGAARGYLDDAAPTH